jgi:hypothetical protein
VKSSDSNFDICSASSASKSGLPVMDVVVGSGVVGVGVVGKGEVGARVGLVCWWMGLIGCCRGARGSSACVANFGNESDCAWLGCARLVKKPSICARDSESIASRQSCAISSINSAFSTTRFADACSHASSASCADGAGCVL